MNALWLKKMGMIVCLMGCLSCTPRLATSASSPVTHVRGMDMDAMNSDILRYINEYRQSVGLGALKMDAAASAQALQHSRDMANGRTGFGHDGFNTRVNNISQQLGRISAAAENVAFGQLSAREVVEGWLNSPGHKKNIEGNYVLTGIGVAEDRDGRLYYTQIFLHT